MSCGILYQFDVYQGSRKQKPKERSQNGVAGNIILDMTSRLEEGKHYKIYVDNFFASLSLVRTLKVIAVYCHSSLQPAARMSDEV